MSLLNRHDFFLIWNWISGSFFPNLTKLQSTSQHETWIPPTRKWIKFTNHWGLGPTSMTPSSKRFSDQRQTFFFCGASKKPHALCFQLVPWPLFVAPESWIYRSKKGVASYWTILDIRISSLLWRTQKSLQISVGMRNTFLKKLSILAYIPEILKKGMREIEMSKSKKRFQCSILTWTSHMIHMI